VTKFLEFYFGFGYFFPRLLKEMERRQEA